MYWVNQLPRREASCLGINSSSSCSSFDPVPCLSTWEISRGGPNCLGLCTHVWDLEETLEYQLWPGPPLIEVIWKVNQQVEDLAVSQCFSLPVISTFKWINVYKKLIDKEYLQQSLGFLFRGIEENH